MHRVLRYLQQQDRPLSAYDIMEGLRPDADGFYWFIEHLRR